LAQIPRDQNLRAMNLNTQVIAVLAS
jgi:hypothetical protein